MQSGIDTSRARTPEGITRITITPEPSARRQFFGEDGPGLGDVIDAINPLNHIPFVSSLLEQFTGHAPSTASKLAGGALFGPLGFAVSLVNVIFEEATGHDVAGAVVAALTGEETPAAATQVAATQAAPVDSVAQEILPPVAASGSVKLAAAVPMGSNQTVLDLYGASPVSAHRSYQKAQMLPYLADVSQSQIL